MWNAEEDTLPNEGLQLKDPHNHHQQQQTTSPTSSTTVVSGKALRTGSFVATPPHLRTTIAKPSITVPSNGSLLFGTVSRSGGHGSELMRQIKIKVPEPIPSKVRLASTKQYFFSLIDWTKIKSLGELERIKFQDEDAYDEQQEKDLREDNLSRRTQSSLGRETPTERSDGERKREELQPKPKPLTSSSKKVSSPNLLRIRSKVTETNLRMLSKRVRERASTTVTANKKSPKN